MTKKNIPIEVEKEWTCQDSNCNFATNLSNVNCSPQDWVTTHSDCDSDCSCENQCDYELNGTYKCGDGSIDCIHSRDYPDSPVSGPSKSCSYSGSNNPYRRLEKNLTKAEPQNCYRNVDTLVQEDRYASASLKYGPDDLAYNNDVSCVEVNESPCQNIKNLKKTIGTKSVNVNTDDIRSFNVGASDYSKHKIQPWDIWEEYDLNPWEADIVKRVLREKSEPGMSWEDSRILDFNKIIHVARKCIELLEKEKAKKTLSEPKNYIKCHLD